MLPLEQVDALLEHYRQSCRDLLLADYHKTAHITLYAAGFPCLRKHFEDDISFKCIEQQAQLLRDLQLKPFDITAKNFNSYPAAPFVEVHDQGELSLLHQCLSTLSGADRDGEFLPHLTLGLYNGAYKVEELAELREIRGELVIRCDKLSLLAYDAADIRSPLRVLQEITL